MSSTHIAPWEHHAQCVFTAPSKNRTRQQQKTGGAPSAQLALCVAWWRKRRQFKLALRISPPGKSARAVRSSSSVSLTAIPRRMHRISSDLRNKAAQGPVSTVVGDRPGRPQGAASFAYTPKFENTSNHCKLCGCHIHWELAGGHTASNAPDPFRRPELSGAGLG